MTGRAFSARGIVAWALAACLAGALALLSGCGVDGPPTPPAPSEEAA